MAVNTSETDEVPADQQNPNSELFARFEEFFKDSETDEVPADHQDSDDADSTATYYMEPKQKHVN
jgi:hypothetical protein